MSNPLRSASVVGHESIDGEWGGRRRSLEPAGSLSTGHNRPAKLGLALTGVIGTIVLSGCGGGTSPAANTLPDGDYSGQTEAESDGSYGVVNFTVSSGAVSAAGFVVYDADGTAHDENYGLGSDGTPADEQFYQRAQNAIAAEKNYVSEFEETGDQEQVESVAGASLSYRLFRAAIDDAIANAGA